MEILTNKIIDPHTVLFIIHITPLSKDILNIILTLINASKTMFIINNKPSFSCECSYC